MMRILIATGGAAHSETAVRLGAQIAARTGATVTLLVVRSPGSDPATVPRILERSIALTTAVEPPVGTKLRVGEPAREIVAETATGDYDLVILGDRPGRNLRKRLLGSTVERVVASSRCPILLARQGRSPQRLLICEGGRQPSLVQRLTTQLAPLLAASQQIVVLHVMSQMAAAPGVPGWELQADAETHVRQYTREGEMLLQDVEALQRSSIVPQVKIRHGLVVDEVVAEAKSGDYDLVVIGAHRAAGWQRFLLDDLAHHIILHTDHSLLILV